jgi:predicted adenylyl cyclase CyaB
MKEVEVKILEVKRKTIEKSLAKLGAKKVFDGDIQTLFFDFKDGKIIKAKDVLRLRKEEDKIELTYKKVRVGKAAKNAEEYSVKVADLEITEKILHNLGLDIIDNMLKHRVSYKLYTARFDMDRYLGKYDFIPELLEIEAENVEAIYKYADLLGYKPKDCLPWSTKELIEHYSKKRKKT